MNTLPSPADAGAQLPATRPRASMPFAMACCRATRSCRGRTGASTRRCSTRWWQSTRRMARPKSTSSRSWLGSSGGSAGCGWQRRPCIGRSSVTTRPAISRSTLSAQRCCRSPASRRQGQYSASPGRDPEDTARDLRDVKRDQAMTRKALNILVAGGPDAYARAVAALREDTRSYWLECLWSGSSDDDPSYRANRRRAWRPGSTPLEEMVRVPDCRVGAPRRDPGAGLRRPPMPPTIWM